MWRWLRCRARILRVGDTINVYIGGSGPADPRVDTILTKIGELSMGIAEVKADLVAVQASLDVIKNAIPGLTGPLLEQIDTLKGQLEAMKTEDAAEDAAITDALTTADAAKASAQAIADLVSADSGGVVTPTE